MNTEKEIGNIIRKLRGDLSLREFSKKCDVSHTTIDNLEKGIDFRTKKPTQVTLNTLNKIASACNVSISYIIGENNSNIFLSEHEKLIIRTYREQQKIQPAVDRLLGIEESNKNTVYTVYNVAESTDNHEGIIEMDAERWDQMEGTPKTDDDLM